MEETPTTTTQSSDSSGSNSKSLWIIGLIILAALAAGGYYFYSQQNGASDNGATGEQNNEAETGPVATVNGVEISRSDYQNSVNELANAAAASGYDAADAAIASQIQEQAVAALVNKELLLQNATKSDISISDEDIEGQYQKVVDSVGGSEALASTLSELGVSDEQLREDLYDQLVIDRYLEAETKYTEIEVTDEEIETYYAEASAGTTDAPALEDIRDVLRAQLLTQKQQQVIAQFIEELRTEAEIEILI